MLSPTTQTVPQMGYFSFAVSMQGAKEPVPHLAVAVKPQTLGALELSLMDQALLSSPLACIHLVRVLPNSFFQIQLEEISSMSGPSVMSYGRAGWSNPPGFYVSESWRCGEALRQDCKGLPSFHPGEGRLLLLIFSDRSGGGGGPGGVIGSCQPGAKIPGEGNNKPLQCPCLENPMVRGAWLATVHGIM